MRAGKLRSIIKIQTVTTTQNAAGEPTRTYATAWEPWAEITSVSGGETLDGKRLQMTGEISHLVKIRYRDGVTRKHRILWGSRAFEISSVLDPDNTGSELWLYCKEVV